MSSKKLVFSVWILIAVCVLGVTLHELKQARELKNKDDIIRILEKNNKVSNHNNCNDALIQIGARMSVYHQKLLDMGLKPNDSIFLSGKR